MNCATCKHNKVSSGVEVCAESSPIGTTMGDRVRDWLERFAVAWGEATQGDGERCPGWGKR